MKSRKLLIGLCLVLVTMLSIQVSGSEFLESLQLDQKVNGFTVKSVYENSAGKLMGARFISDRYGFVLDLMQIQSVPQGFMWVKSAPESDQGEPHACEHLLLGKGSAGRFVATLEDMSLGTSTAYTSQVYTAYPFNTTAGADASYELFEAKLNAMVNPDFTDEEIRREVCKVGVVENSETGLLELAEKGTCYTEMVSSYEKYYYKLYSNLSNMQYGIDHPMTNSAGGNPDSMRVMTAEDMRLFQQSAYRLGNMGIVMSIPDNMDLRECLEKTNGILNRVQATPDANTTASIDDPNLPAPVIDPDFGKIIIDSFPHDNPEEPGYIVMGYPPDLKLGNMSAFLLDLFLETFASGSGTNLYNLFINSETRQLDLGGNSVWADHADDLGDPVYFGLSAIANVNVTEAKMASARALILAEIEKISAYADDSEELAEFNSRAKSRLIENYKQSDKFLNSPPGFGFRSNPGAAWYSIMAFLEKEPGFRKSLVFEKHVATINSLLATNKNFWKDFIDQWQLLSRQPYISGVRPSAALIVSAQKAQAERMENYLTGYKAKYRTEDGQDAIRQYQAEYDAQTAELEAIAANDELPGFVDNPPLSLDESLKYEQFMLGGHLPIVVSSFENMTTTTLGLAMQLDVLSEEQLVYVPFLTDILGEIGVVKDGKVIQYDEMDNRLREEVLGLNSYFTSNMPTNRIELVLRGAGSNQEELATALDWMEALLYTPYLDETNLTRIRDVIDQSLVSLRGTMNAPEEYWVRGPANAYRYQTNPLFMSTTSFLTQIAAYQRLKWLFAEAGNEADQTAINNFIDELALFGEGKTREQLDELFAAVEAGELNKLISMGDNSEAVQILADEILKDMQVTLPGIPDQNLSTDWAYLCGRIKADLATSPADALAAAKVAMTSLTRSDNARMFMISSTDSRSALLPRINEFASRLDAETNSVRQDYGQTNRILDRAKSRQPELTDPTYTGLVYEGTRNGVLMFGSKYSEPYDTSDDAILNILAGKMYSGGGGHGLFMRTWGAGLAYSNGYSINDRTGRVSYYAERCPDVAETMRFVVSVLKDSEEDQRLVEYAIAQMFSGSRAASRYESRGESMAADLTDGYTAETVSEYRKAVLATRNRENLYQELRTRMANIYGNTMIGYGPKLADTDDGQFFMIGPETQFESLTKYIETAEAADQITRLYPRDFWLTN